MTPGTECVIRAAAPADAGAIARLATELARHVRDPDPQLSAAYFEAQLFSAEPWAQCLVAEVRGLVAGYLTYCKQLEIHTGRSWLWIGDLCVAAKVRRTGIARHLISDLRSRARELGCVRTAPGSVSTECRGRRVLRKARCSYRGRYRADAAICAGLTHNAGGAMEFPIECHLAQRCCRHRSASGAAISAQRGHRNRRAWDK